MGKLSRLKARARRYKRAHNILNNNIKNGLKGFYFASRLLGLNRIKYSKGGDNK